MATVETGKVMRPLGLRRAHRFALAGWLAGFFGLAKAAYRMSIDSERLARPRTREVFEVHSDTIKSTADRLRHRSVRSPRVLWADVDGEMESLGALRASVRGAVATAGVQSDPPGFEAHLTLARCGRGGRPESVRGWLKQHAGFRARSFVVSGFTLFSSAHGVYVEELAVPF